MSPNLPQAAPKNKQAFIIAGIVALVLACCCCLSIPGTYLAWECGDLLFGLPAPTCPLN